MCRAEVGIAAGLDRDVAAQAAQQCEVLALRRLDYSLTRYKASALLTFRFNRGAIRSLVLNATAPGLEQAA